MTSTREIAAPDGTRFYVCLASFAYGSFLDSGIGTVLIQEGAFDKKPNGRVEAKVGYVPYSLEEQDFPQEAVDMLNDYDPETELVLSVMDKTGEATCLVLQAGEMGVTPKDAYTQELAAAGKIQFVPGQLLRLKELAGGVEPGWYVYQRQDGAQMALRQVGIDDAEDAIEPTGDELSVHIDFAEKFASTDINLSQEPR